MPYSFHKNWDADCYYRRKYLKHHYQGWRFFPQLRLWFDPTKNEVHLTQPNGASYDFNIAGSKTTLVHPYAVSNVGEYEMPSGKFDQKNTRIFFDNNSITVSSPDGFTRYHTLKKGNLFLLEKEVLPNGKVLKYYYSDLGELSLVESLDPKERYVYASIQIEGSPLRDIAILFHLLGLKPAISMKLGHIRASFMKISDIIRYINGKAACEQFSYDCFGRVIAHYDALGYKTTTSYNEDYVNSLGQKVLQVTTIDPQKITTIETKDPFLRPTTIETLNSKKVIASSEKIYDICGNVTHWKQHLYEGDHYQNTQVTGFTYTSDHKLASSTRAQGTPNARTTSYSYTPDGKVATKMLPDGNILSYSYSPLGFLESLSSSDGKILHKFESNKKGELFSASDEVENISIKRALDRFGNVTGELFPNSIEIKRDYDSFDRIKTLHIANLGYVSYDYDPLFLRSVSRFSANGQLQYAHQYKSYDLDGNLTSEAMINNCGTCEHSFDLKGRKTETLCPYFSQNLLYDACDNVVHSTINQQSTIYTYDDLSQLTSENEATYLYDSLYNRKGEDNKYLKINDLNELANVAYDLNGNLIQKDDIKYTYDPLNRLREAVVGKKKIDFLYDPLGRRLTKTVMEQTPHGWEEIYREHYLYNEQQEIGALKADGTLKNLRVLGTMLRKNLPATIAVEIDNQSNSMYSSE